MKPVVSSIVAFAIAMAPLTAMADETSSHKPAVAKVVKSKKDDKHNKQALSRVHHVTKDKPVHHAHGVQVGGVGHAEPNPDCALTRTALATKAVRVEKPAISTRLVDSNASKASASKSHSEKGARKPAASKKSDIDDGRIERDEDFADLVARITGHPVEIARVLLDAKNDKGAPKLDSRNSHEPACMKDPVEMIRGPEIDTFELATCAGAVAPLAVERVSVLIRPGSAARPTASAAELARKKGSQLAPGIRRVDPRLVLRLQSIVDHFTTLERPAKLNIISGFRPTSVGSMHASGRAIDFRLEGIQNNDVFAFCKTLSDTGCGYYPNSSFVHVDVRDAGKGRVTWIDASGPGEAPRYVESWPLPALTNERNERGDVENAAVTEPASEPSRVDHRPQ
ncbi:MAG: DUF882 domain-containing protein [Polyangiaceae bacterium]|nr:DUF882 domain-containing protein [Polyangiaceae bacterium]